MISAKPASTATLLKAVIAPGGHNSTRGVTPKRDLVLNYALGFPLVHILILRIKLIVLTLVVSAASYNSKHRYVVSTNLTVGLWFITKAGL